MHVHKSHIKVLTFIPVYPYLPALVSEAVYNQTFKGENDVFASLYDPYPTRTPEWGKNLVFKQKKARELCILGDYSHLFMVESDVIPPKHALEALLYMGVPVCCGWYRLNHGNLAGNTSIIQRTMEECVKVQCLEPNVDFTPGDTIPLDLCIFGCTLIRREILEDFNFDTGIDATFSNYCNEHSIPILCNTTLECEHLNLRKNP